VLNAATMLGQRENAYPAKIDSAYEVIDYLRFNAPFASMIYREQPVSDNQSINRQGRNDKPTGAIAGQQPFGGARASGTKDKAGSYLNLIRWGNPGTIKETSIPATDSRYSYIYY
jgi:hypothetical protein